MSMRVRKVELEFNKISAKKTKSHFSIEKCKERWVFYREYQYWYLIKNEYPLDLWYEDKQMIFISKYPPKWVPIRLWEQFAWDEFWQIWSSYKWLYNFIANNDFFVPFFYLFV